MNKIKIRKVGLGWHVTFPDLRLLPFLSKDFTLVCTTWIGAITCALNEIESQRAQTRITWEAAAVALLGQVREYRYTQRMTDDEPVIVAMSASTHLDGLRLLVTGRDPAITFEPIGSTAELPPLSLDTLIYRPGSWRSEPIEPLWCWPGRASEPRPLREGS